MCANKVTTTYHLIGTVVRGYVAQPTGRIGLSNTNNSESHCQGEQEPFKKLWFLIGPKGPHTCGISCLALITPVIMCIIIDLIPILALMPMPYYIFPNAFSEPENRRGYVSSAPASLLHLRSRPPPCSAVLLCVPSAEAQCARAWPRVGRVPVRLPVGLPLPPRACSPNCGLEPPCALTQVRSVSPLRLRAAMAPHLSPDTEAPLS
jgi:hypothetical protein